jgi:hypothetical protein
MSIESFLESLCQGWGSKFSLPLRDVGFESPLDAEELTEDDVRNLAKDSLEKAGALPLHILKMCKGMVKAACPPTQNGAALDLLHAASMPMRLQDVRIDLAADDVALIPPNATTTNTDENAPRAKDKPGHGYNMPRHFASWTGCTHCGIAAEQRGTYNYLSKFFELLPQPVPFD